MKSESLLAIIVLGFLGLLIIAFGGYLWLSRLDINPPTNLKGWLQACSMGAEDIYCKSVLQQTRTIKTPLVVIRPNMGDRPLTELLLKVQKNNNISIDLLIANNIFLTDDLYTGSIMSLSGKEHIFKCEDLGQSKRCSTSTTQMTLHVDFGKDGKVYSAGPLNQNGSYLIQ